MFRNIFFVVIKLFLVVVSQEVWWWTILIIDTDGRVNHTPLDMINLLFMLSGSQVFKEDTINFAHSFAHWVVFCWSNISEK